MAWSDKPTYGQIQAIYRWLEWNMPTPEARRAVKWLENNANRGQVSKEMTRIKKLFDTRTLDMSVFDGEIWKEYPKGADADDGLISRDEVKVVVDIAH